MKTLEKYHSSMALLLLIIFVLVGSFLGYWAANQIKTLQAQVANLENYQDYQININDKLFYKINNVNESINSIRRTQDTNSKLIDQNTASVIENSINIDDISNEGINLRIDEILKDLERIEKRLK